MYIIMLTGGWDAACWGCLRADMIQFCNLLMCGDTEMYDVCLKEGVVPWSSGRGLSPNPPVSRQWRSRCWPGLCLSPRQPISSGWQIDKRGFNLSPLPFLAGFVAPQSKFPGSIFSCRPLVFRAFHACHHLLYQIV